jgi:hypothetical protein
MTVVLRAARHSPDAEPWRVKALVAASELDPDDRTVIKRLLERRGF